MPSRAEVDLSRYGGRIVLVTGASGFIGSALCRRLNELGATIHGVTRRTPARAGPVTFHQADLANSASVDALISSLKPQIVFHLASRVSGSRALDEVMPTFADNLASTVYLLRAVTVNGCARIVIAGSLEATEDGVPSSPYAAAKAAAANYGQMFHALYNTPVTIARIFMVYGPGQRDDRKLVPYVATSLLKGQPPQLSSGVRPVDWVYIDDVVEGLVRCALTVGLEGQSVDIGTGRLTSVRGVAEQIGKLVGGMAAPVFGAIADRGDEQVRAADREAATELLGREPLELDEGLRRTVAWFREQQERSGCGI